MIKEIWAEIPDFDYEISNLGRCRSKERYAKVCGGGKRLIKSQIIKPTVCTNKYLEYNLCKNGKRAVRLAHRLVAEAFIPNPENKREINHLDENVQNNVVTNLSWVTPKENCNYGSRNQKCREANRQNFRAVRQYTKEGQFVKEYESIADASKELGILGENISRAIRGVGGRKYAKGFKWEFVEQGNQNRRTN